MLYHAIIPTERESVKLLVINNLSSGLGEGSVYDFIRSFTEDGDEVCLRSTDGTTDIRNLLRDAESFDAVIASGGDGTVATVSHALANTGIPLMPFPAGNANSLAMNLFSPLEPHALAKIIREGRMVDFDLGEIEIENQYFGFSIAAAAGYDASIMQSTDSAKRLLGPVAYFSSALTSPLPQKSNLTIKLDDKIIKTEGVGILLVNFSKIQLDITTTYDNKPHDGEFDVIILKAQNAFELISALISGLIERRNESLAKTDAIEIHQTRSVRIEADPPLSVQYDGEDTNLFTPFTARILPQSVRLIVSKEGYEHFMRDDVPFS